MIRLVGSALAAALALAACGKYGPPVRASAPTPAPVAAGVSPVPATSDTEECRDPNAISTGAVP